MILQTTIDRKALAEFEEFMTSTLQKETTKAYARGLRLLGAGCVRTITKQLSSRGPGLKEMVDAGIDYAPKKVNRIERLNPMRVTVGVHGFRSVVQKRVFPTKPFVIRWMTKKGHRMKYLVQRATRAIPDRNYKNTTPLWTLFASHQDTFRKKIKQQTVFNALVSQYVEKNHDRVVSRQIERAIERAQK